MDLRREKSPRRGLNWREKVGVWELGFSGENEKWADIMRGELFGEPERLTPDFRVRVSGSGGEAAAAEEGV